MDAQATTLTIGLDEWGEQVALSSPLRSMHVLGVPGMGKSTLLGQLAVWYHQSGCGVVVLDIKDGKLAADVVTQARTPLEEYLLFAPGQTFKQGRSWTLNPLDGEMSDVVDNVLDMFQRVGQLQSSFTQLKEHLSMALRLAVRQPSPTTLHDVADILTDSSTRARMLNVELPKRVRDFWAHEFAALGKKAQHDAVSSTVVRLDDWLVDEPLATLLAGPKSTLRLAEELDAGRLIVCDLVTDMPAGQVLETGNLVMASILNAALARDPHADKRPWVVIADEFDLLAGDFFRHSLDKLRAAGLRVVAAHQNLSQVSSELASSLTSVPLKVYFKPSPKDLKELKAIYPGTKELWSSLAEHQAAVLEEGAVPDPIPWLDVQTSGWVAVETSDWPDQPNHTRLAELSRRMLQEPYTRPLDSARKDVYVNAPTTERIEAPPRPPEGQPAREAVSDRAHPPRPRRAGDSRQMRLLDALAVGPPVLPGRDDDGVSQGR